jgi:hypothetical protein
MSETNETIEAGGQYGKALHLAHLKAEHLNKAASVAADAKDEFSGAPIKLYVAMLTDLDDDTISGLPVVGSDTGNNPDIFMWKDPNSDAKEREISFYTVWSDNTVEGLKVAQELAWLKALGNPDMKDDDIPADFKAKYDGPARRESRKKYLTTRRATIRNCYKKAVQLMHQLDAINELKGIEAKLVPVEGEDNVFENFIHVRTKFVDRQTVDTMHLTVSQFLNLKPAKIAEGGGTYAAMKASIVRKPKGKKEKGGIPAIEEVRTGETLDKIMTAAHHYLDHLVTDKKGKDWGDFLKFLTGPGGGSAIETLGDIRNCIDDIFKLDKVSFIYAKVKEDAFNKEDESEVA